MTNEVAKDDGSRTAHPPRGPGSALRSTDLPAPVVSGGERDAAIARAVVRICRSVAGRGPARAHAFYRGNVYVIIMEETQTQAEKSLIANGRSDVVLTLRNHLQAAMRDELIALIEQLTGCAVTAFLSASSIVPDVSSEVFILDQSLDDRWRDPDLVA